MQYALREFFRHPEDMKAAGLDGSLDNKRVIVQGLGNVGYHAAKFLQEEDSCLITGIIERDGALTNDDGIDVEAVRAHIMVTGGVKGFDGATYVENGSTVLEKACDILIPAALEGVINLDNAARIDTKVIIEAANGPVTAGADEILRDKGVVIIPDMYANAGGVTVSYFEWVKNLSHIRFGRMQRREEEARNNLLVAELDRLDQYLGDRWSMTLSLKSNICAARANWNWCVQDWTTPCALPINKCLNVGTAVMMSRICGRPPLCWRLTKSRQAIARKASKQKRRVLSTRLFLYSSNIYLRRSRRLFIGWNATPTCASQ